MQLALAVDGHSMFHVQQKLGWFFDPRRLLELAASRPGLEIGSAFWYAGLKDAADQRPFRDALTSLGYTVRTKPLREVGGEGDQRLYARANLELEIAIDLLTVAPRSDEVWLLSGSRDLERLLEVLRVRGLKTVLIHADGMAPRELRNAADRFLDLASLRPQLERLEGQPQAAASRTL